MNRPVRESAGNRIGGMSMSSQVIPVIQNNPFRILGVYANASAKEIVGNIGKAKAFLRVHTSECTKENLYSTDIVYLISSREQLAQVT